MAFRVFTNREGGTEKEKTKIEERIGENSMPASTQPVSHCPKRQSHSQLPVLAFNTIKLAFGLRRALAHNHSPRFVQVANNGTTGRWTICWVTLMPSTTPPLIVLFIKHNTSQLPLSLSQSPLSCPSIEL